ncbi:heparan-alpha-glucosaminide N-acetyltransferase-like [Tribolium madens]|uniref:heparan-alpha-glucosaminide N-acetyltransferase-like n=1 Tax=Tribolium madens TaxID=41895 RepID=UPI001CF75618|nr:heparan-alpha-glucosaminide N-acetyltransferase-like [Tribolium madens]
MLFKNSNKCLSPSPNLIFDEACIDITNLLNDTASVWGQYSECHNCDFQNLTTLEPHKNTSILVNTRYPLELFFVADAKKQCSVKKLLYEHYRYGWNITEKCSNLYIKEPADSAYLPILTAFIVLCSFGTFWYMVKCIYKNSGRLRGLVSWNAEIESDLGGSSAGTPLVIERTPSIRKHPHRIKSIDVFRGFCIMVMIFVNYGGGKYWFFTHSVWNGITVADLVFPWFLWLMGVSFAVSLQAKLRRAVPRRQLVIGVMRRSFILILLGIIINSNQNLQTIGSLRFPGVLQRFGVTYFIVGLLEIIFTKRTEVESVSCIYDVAVAWPQWLFVTILVIIHTCITFLVHVPGCGKGYLGPGGLDDHGKFYNCTGGVAGYIDRQVFGEHMYKNPACKKLYEIDVYFDPEGILGTLTSVLTVYFGVQAGRTLNTYQNVKAKVIRWVIWGSIVGLIGGTLCEFKQNDGLIPLNKQLWSLSFTLVLSGMAFFIQAFLFVLVDILRKWGGRPFFYPGMNSLFLYVGHELFRDTFPFAWTPTSETHGAYLLMNLWGTAVWVAISIFLYKRNVFFAL